MTTAPPELLKARTLLLAHLDMHPGRVAADLDPDEVGIVGDPDHRGGYHCGSDRTVSGDYSVVESSRDRAGLSTYASALDVGEFDVVSKNRRWTLRDFSAWLVGECSRNGPDTQDIREVIYSVDGRTVKRWDRLGRRSTGDSSHLWHTHISEFRDARGRKMVGLMTRWLTYIGLGDEDMALDDVVPGTDGRTVGVVLSDLFAGEQRTKSGLSPAQSTQRQARLAEIAAYAKAAAEKPPVTLTDAQLDQLADKVAERLAGVSELSDAEVARIAKANADENARRQVA